jgi:hypothetical protein
LDIIVGGFAAILTCFFDGFDQNKILDKYRSGIRSHVRLIPKDGTLGKKTIFCDFWGFIAIYCNFLMGSTRELAVFD